jgi:hypothetical protein
MAVSENPDGNVIAPERSVKRQRLERITEHHRTATTVSSLSADAYRSIWWANGKGEGEDRMNRMNSREATREG